ncbi:hypothetical protein ACFFX0_06260 [Citricoccus parietis]|uniref:Uncharacterized protein n=1 Tax=Citricoccus parietis TaxID=592307 RepID=A0ABV5FWH7_9MICC
MAESEIAAARPRYPSSSSTMRTPTAWTKADSRSTSVVWGTEGGTGTVLLGLLGWFGDVLRLPVAAGPKLVP